MFGKAAELCRVTGTSLYAVMNRGSQIRVEGLLYRVCKVIAPLALLYSALL